jgi:hypothetical protein
MIDLMINNLKTFSPLSSTFNSIFSLAATGVENDHGGGFERRVGDHAVTLSGRTVHFVPRATSRTDPSGGISYFVFDHTAAEAIRKHVFSVVSRRNNQGSEEENTAATEESSSSNFPQLSVDTALRLRDELLAINPYCKELQFVGSIISQLSDENIQNITPATFERLRRATIVEASLGHAVQYFDVAHLTADRATGARVVRFNTIAGKRGELDMNSKHVEPLCYPLLFCHGEDGWGQQDSDDIPYNRYLSSRLLLPDLKSHDVAPNTSGPDFLTVEHETDFVEIVSFNH